MNRSKMRSISVLVFVSVVSLTANAAFAESEHGIPSTIKHSEPVATAPIWVSAEAAGDGAGGLDEDRLPNLSRMLREVLRFDHEMGCYFFGPSEAASPMLIAGGADATSGAFAAQDTLEDLRKNAKAIFEGQVVAVSNGFYAEKPGTLLQVRVTDVIRDHRGYDLQGDVFLHYPYARFSVGGLEFCKLDPRFSYRPAVGDQLIVFAFLRSLGEGQRVIDISRNGLFAQKVDGELEVPAGIRERGGAKDLQELKDLGNDLRRRLRSESAAEDS